MSDKNLKVIVQEKLFLLQDKQYKKFNSSLIPTIQSDSIIGVRIPILRNYTKELTRSINIDNYFELLPHDYLEENLLHAFLIAKIQNFDLCIKKTEEFLPFIDNWEVCDTFSPDVFKKDLKHLLPYIEKWIKSSHTYIVRFGICMLMRYFLDNNFKEEYLELVASIHSNEYYINMMKAWYFATALFKQYESTIKYIEGNLLDEWTHNMTIKKASESRRIPSNIKQYLYKLKRKNS